MTGDTSADDDTFDGTEHAGAGSCKLFSERGRQLSPFLHAPRSTSSGVGTTFGGGGGGGLGGAAIDDADEDWFDAMPVKRVQPSHVVEAQAAKAAMDARKRKAKQPRKKIKQQDGHRPAKRPRKAVADHVTSSAGASAAVAREAGQRTESTSAAARAFWARAPDGHRKSNADAKHGRVRPSVGAKMRSTTKKGATTSTARARGVGSAGMRLSAGLRSMDRGPKQQSFPVVTRYGAARSTLN